MKSLPCILVLLVVNAQAATVPSCTDPFVLETIQEAFWNDNLRLGPVPDAGRDVAYGLYAAFAPKNVKATGTDGSQRASCSAALTTGQEPIELNYTVRADPLQPVAVLLHYVFAPLPPAFVKRFREALAEAIRPR